MSFFDDKQEVIDLQLTEYGKFLLSKGKLDPQFYAFFDDNILYDCRYAQISESQNNSQDRILNLTPSQKTQVVFTTVENTVKEQNEQKLKDDLINNFANRELNMSNIFPLGTSEYNSSFYPSWNISVLSGSILDTSTYEQKVNGLIINIPQINLKPNYYRVFVADTNKSNFFNSYVDNNDKTFIIEGDYANLYYFFDIQENNSLNLKQDFQLEVFEEQEKTIFSGTVYQETYKVWNQLYFDKKPINIKDDILLDEYLYSENFLIRNTPANVEWFLEMYVDEEIMPPEQIRNKTGIVYGISVDEDDAPFGEEC